MAYLKKINKPRCKRCQAKPAGWILYNRVNAPEGYYCGSCAKKQLKEFEAIEKAGGHLTK